MRRGTTLLTPRGDEAPKGRRDLTAGNGKPAKAREAEALGRLQCSHCGDDADRDSLRGRPCRRCMTGVYLELRL